MFQKMTTFFFSLQATEGRNFCISQNMNIDETEHYIVVVVYTRNYYITRLFFISI